MQDTMTYRLAKDLARILTPLSGQTKYTIKNSTKFVEWLREDCTGPEDLMVSYDVTSLLTQVPIDEALKVVKARRTKDPTLVDRTSIPVPQLVELIELCLRSTYFRFQNNFFEQIDGTPMGSPLSPVIANLFIEDLAEQAMHTSTRCLSTNIQFTIKKEEEGRLAFLDVLMIHSKDQLSTTVYI